MKKVLVLVYSDLNYDARVRRQIKWLAKDYKVTVVCFKKGVAFENVAYREIKQTGLTKPRKAMLALALILRIFRLAYWLQHGYYFQLNDLESEGFDIIIANDLETVPLAFQLSRQAKTKVILDAHEYSPRHFEERRWWKVLFSPWYYAICRKYIPRLLAMTTVSGGLAVEYEKEFGLKPDLITNAPPFHELSPGKVTNPVRLVHHGIVNQSRKLELMIDIMTQLGNGYELDIYLMIPEYASESTISYYESLKAQVALTDNVKILPKLDNDKIVSAINSYDMGLFLLEPVNFNYTHALPNKLFDFIQARLAIAIGPSLEMKRVVEQYNLGIVSKSFDPADLAQEIKKLSHEDIFRFKQNSHAAAFKLSEEQNKLEFLRILEEQQL